MTDNSESSNYDDAADVREIEAKKKPSYYTNRRNRPAANSSFAPTGASPEYYTRREPAGRPSFSLPTN